MKVRIALAALAAVATTGACSSFNDSRGRGDAPVSKYDDSPARVINMPDKFANVAFKCMGVNGIYSTTRAAAPVVIANDPECTKKSASPQ